MTPYQVLSKIYGGFFCTGITLKDVRAHFSCASLVRTLYMTWRVARHAFQARAPSRNSTKYWADDLCGKFICEYFCWMLVGPTFFGKSRPFLILSITDQKTKRFNYSSYTIQLGSNWCMDTGVRDLEVAYFKANYTWFNDICSQELSHRPIYAVLNTLNLDIILQLKYMPIVMNTARIALSNWKS